MAPISWNGSQVIYNKVIRPIFLRYEAVVDDIVNDIGGRAMSAAEGITREVLCTLMKNNAVVALTPAQPETKSLPSSSTATVAPSDSKEEQPVRIPQLHHPPSEHKSNLKASVCFK
ncbi:hypothetical protein CgunFtcFv8_026377 [Champsocephalus gunnari]|uniref:Uncharacterized protein n=1 Tax=Champsocephalus gunnari TaxID=52237 RepID=A0AAN8HVZ6_CHAGU|nr:hypothetical protein CgunFtcFv8_026377 [Champsocephalus gunnari]